MNSLYPLWIRYQTLVCKTEVSSDPNCGFLAARVFMFVNLKYFAIFHLPEISQPRKILTRSGLCCVFVLSLKSKAIESPLFTQTCGADQTEFDQIRPVGEPSNRQNDVVNRLRIADGKKYMMWLSWNIRALPTAEMFPITLGVNEIIQLIT